jgi:hypothetical protein
VDVFGEDAAMTVGEWDGFRLQRPDPGEDPLASLGDR